MKKKICAFMALIYFCLIAMSTIYLGKSSNFYLMAFDGEAPKYQWRENRTVNNDVFMPMIMKIGLSFQSPKYQWFVALESKWLSIYSR